MPRRKSLDYVSEDDIKACPFLSAEERNYLLAVKGAGSLRKASRVLNIPLVTLKRKVDEAEGKLRKWIDEGGRVTVSKTTEAKEETPIHAEDIKTIQKIRETPVSAKRPIIQKEIEAQAWFHHLLIDLGRDFLILGLTNLGIPEDKIYEEVAKYRDNYEALRDKITEFFTELVKLRKEAWKLRELENDLKLIEAEYDFLKVNFDKLYDVYRVAVSSMCPECKKKFLLNLALKQVVGV